MHTTTPGVDVGYMSFSLVDISVIVVAMNIQLLVMYSRAH